MSTKVLLFILLISAWACVPKPEAIQGCGSGTEFNNDVLGCVSANPAITLSSTLTTLAVVEDVAASFTLPDATTDATGSLYWFISSAPSKGKITACADRAVDDTGTGVGTALRSCVYTPNANYVGSDSFAYKICNTESGASRCGTAITVSVTISDDGLDLPLISTASAISVYENTAISFSALAQRQSTGEANPIYLCVDVVDPDGVMSAEAATKVVTPSGAIAFGSTCTQIASENDNLNVTLATFTATANLLACPLDDCTGEAFVIFRMCESSNCDVTGIDGVDNDIDGQIDEADEWLAADLLNVTVKRVPVTILARNFNPTIGGSSPLVLASIAEGAAAMTIGTAGGNDRILTNATDLDGDSVTYEYIPTSYFPGTAGAFSCTNGANLLCNFTPDADFNGSITFKYLARDSKSAASNIVTVTMSISSSNDAPIFITGTHIDGYSTVPIALQESTVLSARTLKVGEGGGGYENSQTLTLLATSDNLAALPPGNIQVKRGTTTLGTLSSVTPLTLDSSTIDADAQTFYLSFTPVSGYVGTTPINIGLTLNDGFTTTPFSFSFTGVNNVDNAPSFSQDPATSLAFQLGAAAKNLTFRATPGSNDWAAVTGGGQSLTLTLTSTSGTVVNLTSAVLSTAGGGITITPGACSSTSCVYTITYDGSNDPADDDFTLAVTPGIRGSSTVTMKISDGTVANDVTKTTTVNVYNFVATFNGWNDVKMVGEIRDAVSGNIVPPSLTLGWDALTLLEGGTPTTAYKVLIYRNTINDFSTLPSNSLMDAGTASSSTSQVFTTATAFDDGAGFVAGTRYYFKLFIVPTALGELVSPSAVADQIIEVVIPPDNMVMVHRWMANRKFCEETGQTHDRASGTYRCLNLGVGAILDTGVFYYDQVDHLFINRFEAGCPFNFTENTRSMSAVGQLSKIHYERSTGECRYSDNASWILIDNTVPLASLNSHLAELPPLVKISRSVAHSLCGIQSVNCSGSACAGAFAGDTPELPVRREMVAASTWPAVIPGGLTQAGVEDSADHAGSFACNTNMTSQLSFSDPIPALSSDIFPFTSSSGFKGLINSSSATAYCESRYGLRNHIGNVSEWLADRYNCAQTLPTSYSCAFTGPIGTGRDDSDPTLNSYGITYGFDNAAKHGIELTYGFGYLVLDYYMNVNADRFHLAMGLPFEFDAGVTGTKYGLPEYVSPASPPTQIDGGTWGYDGMGFLSNVDSADYAIVQGGDWSISGAAGRFAIGLQEGSDTNAKTGYRCVIRKTPVP
ncbi:MAG: cadherin-like domain-containing protein [Bacteriovoracaceae bacterium]|nr:cadherin-like domain-containing protein [Bacteriovoracaceae bacterium]